MIALFGNNGLRYVSWYGRICKDIDLALSTTDVVEVRKAGKKWKDRGYKVYIISDLGEIIERI